MAATLASLLAFILLGAMIGAILINVIKEVSGAYDDDLNDIIVYGVFVCIFGAGLAFTIYLVIMTIKRLVDQGGYL
jgi:tellurite resistance protein TehA-like permease